MPAPKGNQYGKGNSGGYAMPKEYREKVVKLKALVIDESLRIMDSGTRMEKMEVIKKVLPSIAPQEWVGDFKHRYVISRGGSHGGPPLGPASEPSVDSG